MADPIKNRPLPDEKIGGEDADLLRIARERYQKAIDADADNREAAIEDLEFLSGDQWPAEIRREREEDGRPVLTIDRLSQAVAQVIGDIRQNHPSVKVRPADDIADDKIADVYTGLIRHIEAQSDAGVAYVTAAEAAVRCGIGHLRVVTEYASDDTFEQDIRVRRIVDPFSVTWDPHAVEPTRSDARYCFVEESLDKNTFTARYPNASLAGFDFQDRSQSYVGGWLQGETIRVAEYWTREMKPATLALLDDGRTIDATDMKAIDRELLDGIDVPFEAAYQADDGIILLATKVRKVHRPKVEMRIINGSEVLEGPFEWAGQYIPIIPVLGEEIFIQNKTVRFGIIRNAKDAQRMYNYWRAAQTEKIALEPKVPFLVTAANIKGLESIWQQANTRNLPYLPYTPDPLNQGREPGRNAPQMGSASMHQEIMLAADDMKATTKIYDAGLGQRSNEQSGIAITARQRESDTGTFVYADNLARAIRRAGTILVDLIPKIYDTERQVRILNEDDTGETVTINQTITGPDGTEQKINDIGVGKYDVVVTTGPSFTTKRAEAAEGMMQLAQAVPDKAALFLDLIVQNLDWPGADMIAERLRKTLPPGLVEPEEGEEPPPPSPPTPEQLAQAAEAEAAQREQARKDAEAAADIAETEADTDGKRLANAKAAMELAMADGALQQMVAAQVEAVLAQMFQQQPAPMMRPGEEEFVG